MSIEYGVYSIGNNRYAGRVLNSGHMSEEQFFAELHASFPDLGSDKLKEIFARAVQLVNEGVADNKVVQTPLANYRAAIKGPFPSVDAHFNVEVNSKDLTANRPRAMQEAMQHVHYNKVAVRTVQPHPADFYDAHSETHNDILSSGGLAELAGDQLAFSKSTAKEGIFFSSLKDGTETAVQDYLKITENRVSFSVPAALPAGDYILLVRRHYTVHDELRSGQLNAVLTLS